MNSEHEQYIQSHPKNILVLSDDDRVARVIELVLKRDNFLGTNLVISSFEQQNGQPSITDLSLVILVASLPVSETMMTLNQASLADHIGSIPMLIISSETFHANPDNLIFHLKLPFDFDELHHKVQTLLRTYPHPPEPM